MIKMSFEQAVKRLDEIAAEMEVGESTLDKSMELYEEGVKLIAHCNDMLNKAEQKIETFGGQNNDG